MHSQVHRSSCRHCEIWPRGASARLSRPASCTRPALLVSSCTLQDWMTNTHAISIAATLEFVDHTISSLKCNPPIALYSHLTKGKDTSETSSVTDSPLEKDVKDMTALGRPCLADHVRRITSLPGSVAVVACGPDAFNRDVKAAVAEAQWRIVKGKTETTECWLHAESFSW